MEQESKWEPKLLGFLCRWCSYAGADLAGTSRFSYPPNIRIIRVPCSGRVDPLFVCKALLSGADAVLVGGCHPGDCHYSEGNYFARRKLSLLKRLLEYLGIEKERFRIEWISASEGNKLVRVVKEMVEDVKKIGPNKIRH